MALASTRVITEYFPSIGNMQMMMQHQHLLLEYGENYQKNSLRNRCYLASSQGVQLLSVPLLKGKHQQQPIYEVRIAYHENWPLKHLRSIETNYNKAPFYPHFIDAIQAILNAKPVFLVDLNWSILEFLFQTFSWYPSISCSLDHDTSDLNQKINKQTFKPYPQQFEDKLNFLPNLSILDLLFCIGPQTKYIYH